MCNRLKCVSSFLLVVFVVLCVGFFDAYAQNCDLGVPSTTPPTDITVFIGDDEEFSAANNRGTPSAASRTALDAQDDGWRNSAVLNSLTSISTAWTGGTGATSSNTASTPLSLFTHGGISVSSALHNVSIGNSDCDGTINVNQGNLSASNTLQDTAPRPQQFYVSGNQPRYFTENAGSSTSRNSIVFNFSSPVKAFGAWFGDMETRNDGSAEPALLRLVDSSGNRIGNDIIIPPNGTVDQTICGGSGASSPPSACGNETTRWVGFVDSDTTARVSKAIVIVGDDDSGGSGNSQRLSFIGATIATLAPTAADVTVTGRVVDSNNLGLSRVYVEVLNTSTNEIKGTFTNAFGYFKFIELEAGDFYIATVKHKTHFFEVDTLSFQVFDNLNNLRFVSSSGSFKSFRRKKEKELKPIANEKRRTDQFFR